MEITEQKFIASLSCTVSLFANRVASFDMVDQTEIDFDALLELDGLSLGAAFCKFVMRHPEVAALGEEMSRDNGEHGSVFTEGMFPGPLVDFRWPIDINADQLAGSFVNGAIMFAGDPIIRPSESIKRAAKTISNRIDQ